MRLKRLLLRLVCAAVGLLGLAPVRALAQSYLAFSASCGTDAITVTLDVHDGGTMPNLVGFDVYRNVQGACTLPVRITEVPWSREPGQHFTRQLVDGDRAPGVTYHYGLVGVDASRNQFDLYAVYDPSSSVLDVYPACGEAPIGRGWLHDFGYTLSFEPCPGWCASFALLGKFPAALRDYADTGFELVLYGNIVCGTIEGCLLNVDSAEVSPCTVAVTPSTWGRVKRIYR